MMDPLSAAVVGGASAEDLAELPLPESYRGACLRRSEEGIFGAGETDRDVRRTIHLDEMAMPEIEADEVVIAVMASAINYNTVWSATFLPVSTFRFLDQYARTGSRGARHARDLHAIGSDASGVVVRTGSLVRHWKVGDHVVVNTLQIDDQDPMAQWDGMLPADQRAWGFETNFGGLAHYAVVHANQLLAKAPHLTWEEAASTTLCLMTAYRMLISERAAGMRLGDLVLIWGATGGLGAFATQLVRAAGGRAVGIVSSPDKVQLAEQNGCELALDRTSLALSEPGGATSMKAWRELGALIRGRFGEDPDIVFEHVGRETFGASVFLARRGGTVVTCGSSTGYQHEFDNRFLWMRLKRIVGSHGANYRESWQANRLLERGVVQPTLSTVTTLADAGEATRRMQLNQHVGKIGVLCLAPERGLGVTDPAMRERIGTGRIGLFEQFELEQALVET